MNILYAYYSFEGNCRELARVMAAATGGTLLELSPVREIPRGFLRKYAAGGRSALRGDAPELAPYDPRPRDFDLTVVGGPVWAWHVAPPVRSFLLGEEWTGLRVALFAMHRGGPGGVLASMRALVEERGGSVRGESAFVDLRRKNAEETKARAVEWASSLQLTINN